MSTYTVFVIYRMNIIVIYYVRFVICLYVIHSLSLNVNTKLIFTDPLFVVTTIPNFYLLCTLCSVVILVQSSICLDSCWIGNAFLCNLLLNNVCCFVFLIIVLSNFLRLIAFDFPLSYNFVLWVHLFFLHFL